MPKPLNMHQMNPVCVVIYIDCLIRTFCSAHRSGEFDLKPRHLKSSFQPFSLLPPEEQRRLDSLEKMVLHQMSRARDTFVPGVG